MGRFFINWGLVRKREGWTLTWRALTGLILLLVCLAVAAAKNVCSFLAPSNPGGEGILVVEGWLPDYALRVAVDLFRTNHYARVLVPGNSISHGYFLSDYKDWGHLGEASLKKLGLSSNSVVAIEPPPVHRDRTYASALAAKKWMAKNYPSIKKVDVVSLGVHTRRTRYLYQRAFGPEYEVGSVAARDEDYEPNEWWRTSAGFRTVTGEVIAYLYAVVHGV